MSFHICCFSEVEDSPQPSRRTCQILFVLQDSLKNVDIVVKLILLYHTTVFHAAGMKVFRLKESEHNNVGI